MTRLSRLSAFLMPALPLLIPVVALASFYLGRNAERNSSSKAITNMVHEVKVENLKDERQVRALLERYTKAMLAAADRFEVQTHHPIAPQERKIFEWMYTNTMHPCPLPDEMLAFHATALMNASRELVLVGPK